MTEMDDTSAFLPNCSVFFDSYIKVTYQNSCQVNQLDQVDYPHFARLYVSISLSILGAFFNLWALILLILDYHGPPTKSSHPKNVNVAKPGGVNHASKHTSSRRTTMQIGLITFCLFEVLYHGASSGGESIHLFAYKQIAKGALTKPVNGTLTYIYSVLPPLTSFFHCIRDTGICGRNWAITLITIARAEVVLWPLGSRVYQRCLRQKRIFLPVFVLFALMGFTISTLRRFDQQISVCYSESLNSHCVFSEPYMQVDFKSFSAVYFSFQTLLPWMLILIFTTLIICQLNPCKRHSENFIHRPTTKYGGRDNNIRASIAVTVIAVFCTIFEFPTFALSMYYIASNPHEALEIWDTIANTLLQIDSIANFFLLIITMPSLRSRLRRAIPAWRQRDDGQQNEPRSTVAVEVELTSKNDESPERKTDL